MKTLIFVLILLMLVTLLYAGSWKAWDSGAPIKATLLPQYAELKPGELVEFSISAEDLDHWAKYQVSGEKSLKDFVEEGNKTDELELPLWFCDGGEWLAFGKWSRQYRAPQVKGEYNITVVLEDIGAIPKNEEGSRKDAKATLKAKVLVK